MNSFSVFAVGHLARNPEVSAKGDMIYTRFCLIGNDYVGRDESGNAREVATSVWFVAFNGLGETIARNARTGDQLIVEACIRSNTWTDQEGATQYGDSYIVEGFRFGAPGRLKRAELQAREGERRED
jgi:single-strand DNA-binding protein